MHHIIGVLAIGMLGGGVAGDPVRRRRIVRGVVKGGIVARRKMEIAASQAVAATRKVVEEARAELDHAGTGVQ